MATATLSPPAKQQPKVKRKYRLLAGSHISGERVPHPDPELAAKGETVERVFSANDPDNNIVETHLDLVRLHGREKFQLVGEPAVEPGHVSITVEELERLRQIEASLIKSAATSTSQTSAASTTKPATAPDFGRMSEKELRAYADTAEIDVTKCRNRDELLKVISTKGA